MKNIEKRQGDAKPLSLDPLVGGENPNPNGKNGKPFIIAPLTFDQALRKILAAPPKPKADKPKKKPSKKR